MQPISTHGPCKKRDDRLSATLSAKLSTKLSATRSWWARENGALMIEATLTLSIYLFAMLAFMGLLRVVEVESITQHAINQAAMEL